MQKELEDHALMCCAIQTSSSEEMEERTDLGLVKGDDQYCYEILNF